MSKIAQLKDEMLFFKSLSEVIDVLKSAASAQFRNVQSKANIKRDFVKSIAEAISFLLGQTIYSRYFMELKNAPSLILCITSDGGFLGELNTLSVNTAVDSIGHKDDEIVVMGERGGHYLNDMGKPHTFFKGISDNLDQKEAYPIRAYLFKRFREVRFGRIIVVYPRFISMSNRKIECRLLLPLVPSLKNLSEEAGIRVTGKETPVREEDVPLIEPSAEAVLEVLARMWVGYWLHDIFCSSKLCEYSARIMHLELSTEELKTLNRQLLISFFRTKHGLSDKNIREVQVSRLMLRR